MVLRGTAPGRRSYSTAGTGSGPAHAHGMIAFMARATWNGVVLARSDDTVIVEGNHYFPRDSLDERYFEPSEHTSVCFWKGTAGYFHVRVGGKQNDDAAWYYPEPKPAARNIQGRVAFWRGVVVEP